MKVVLFFFVTACINVKPYISSTFSQRNIDGKNFSLRVNTFLFVVEGGGGLG